jgi:hypothetical protein
LNPNCKDQLGYLILPKRTAEAVFDLNRRFSKAIGLITALAVFVVAAIHAITVCGLEFPGKEPMQIMGAMLSVIYLLYLLFLICRVKVLAQLLHIFQAWFLLAITLVDVVSFYFSIPALSSTGTSTILTKVALCIWGSVGTLVLISVDSQAETSASAQSKGYKVAVALMIGICFTFVAVAAILQVGIWSQVEDEAVQVLGWLGNYWYATMLFP